MTPVKLFEYIIAVVLGTGLSLIVLLYIFAQMVDWEKYEAKMRNRCKCTNKNET